MSASVICAVDPSVNAFPIVGVLLFALSDSNSRIDPSEMFEFKLSRVADVRVLF